MATLSLIASNPMRMLVEGATIGDFTDLRNDTTAGTATTNHDDDWWAGGLWYDLSDGYWYVYRTAMRFDNSGIGSNTVESAELKLLAKGRGSDTNFNNGHKAYLVRAKDGASYGFGTLNNSDYDSMDGWVSSGTYDGNVTAYSSEQTFSYTSDTWHTITLNSNAITDLNNESGFDCMLISNWCWTGDATDSPALNQNSDASAEKGVRFYGDGADSSEEPYLNVTYGAGTSIVTIKSGIFNVGNGNFNIK
jgi:hypothetical protein